MQHFRSAFTARPVVIAIMVIAAWPCRVAADFTLVSNGEPQAAIVTPNKPGPTVRDAAKRFQRIVAQMTGANLAIKTAGEYDGQTPPIFIGQSDLVKQRGINVAQDFEQADHYIIRVTNDYIALVGNDDQWLWGSSYAAFDLLQRLGCGWFGPDPIWHVIPKSDMLIASELAVDERPNYQMRQIWMVKDDLMHHAWRLGGINVPASHNLERLVPPHELAEKHPDWFGPGRAQPCLTHPDVQQHIVKVLRKQIDASKRKVTRLTISPNDTDQFCQCDRCREAGNVSSRLVKFAGHIADGLRKTHEGRFKLMFLAYWVAHSPPRPMVTGPPELIVMMVNEGDHAHPLDMPVPPEHAARGRNNLREQRNMAGWQKTGSLSALYEWWIPGCSNPNWRSVPWYSGETALRNLRYWQQRGIKYITYETQYENGSGFPIRWPLYYMAARGTWDTSLHADDVMREACTKLYGPAAKDMFGFYRILEKAMLETNKAGGNWHLPSPELIYSPQIEDEATAHLQHAATKTRDAAINARIASERKMWNQARQVMAKLRAKSAGVEAFAIKLDDAELKWRHAQINAQTIRDLFNLKPDVPLQVVEIDGQTRLVQAGEQFDLRTNVTFRKQPK